MSKLKSHKKNQRRVMVHGDELICPCCLEFVPHKSEHYSVERRGFTCTPRSKPLIQWSILEKERQEALREFARKIVVRSLKK